ncbi:MAG: malto-oligosyltrehalose trehalohydrolase [Bryobacteraceae bacterium]|nr:malto-oligosyltrehalose trehalohydrolase [Bryobacteraceae bacterium]
MPVGAEVVGDRVHCRVWAPLHNRVEVVFAGGISELQPEGNEYFSGWVDEISHGGNYRLRVDGQAFPDPASRFQPEGPHGPSQIVDASRFRWRDAAWNGTSVEQAVIYEMHIGTFTPEGNWASAMARLPGLRDLGITVLEVMPVADFSGNFGWGYDGVNMFAPTRLYGTPDDMRRFVDEAHSLNIGVILDVVYNHFGADGNYIGHFSADYVTIKHKTDWGAAINFDGRNSRPVREFFIANAGYWIEEFHLDGLRLDATQNIYDDSEPHILLEITRSVRASGKGRKTLVVAENESQHTKLVREPASGGYGMDCLWNDDLHHIASVALTGHNDAYYTDYQGTPQEFVSAVKYGYLYQGQWYKWQKQRRGTPALDLSPSAFVAFIENHDQIANSARGWRMHQQSAPGNLRALTTLILAGPGTPMLFQGQEFLSSKPFLYFADVPENLAKLVREGRQEFMKQWRSAGLPGMLRILDDPCSPQTFEKCKLDFSELERNSSVWQMHSDLLRLRREDPVLSSWRRGHYDGAVLGPQTFVIRAFGGNHGDRLMLINLGVDLHLNPAPEPLLAPTEESEWAPLFSTEDSAYGGCGTPPLDTDENWRIPGHAAVIMRTVPAAPKPIRKKENAK